jgi:hypothetical protein
VCLPNERASKLALRFAALLRESQNVGTVGMNLGETQPPELPSGKQARHRHSIVHPMADGRRKRLSLLLLGERWMEGSEMATLS